MAPSIFNLGILPQIPKNRPNNTCKNKQAYLNYARHQKEKRELRFFIFMSLIFQVNIYDKELLLNVVVCLLIALKHHQVSQKPSQKNGWLCIRKPLGKIPQETTELNA